MPVLFALDLTRGLTHNDVKGTPGGASEYQFYRLLEHLAASNFFDKVQCYNTIHQPTTADHVSFFPYANFPAAVANEDTPPIVLVQRFWPNIHSDIAAALSVLPRVFLWLHDGDGHSLFKVFNKDIDLPAVQQEINRWPGIAYIPVSNYMKEILLQDAALACKPMHVIHNALYEDELQLPHDLTHPLPLQDRTHLVFASSWQKGIREVVPMFEKLVEKEPRYVLELVTPGYEGNAYDAYKIELRERLGDRVLIHPPKKRQELAAILANALVVLTAPFRESFGCVFAEALHLGAPVLVDARSGAVSEIVGEMCEVVSYYDVDQCRRVIESLRNGPIPSLAPHFKLPFLLERWKTVLLDQNL